MLVLLPRSCLDADILCALQWTGGPCTSNVVVPQTAFSVTKGTSCRQNLNSHPPSLPPSPKPSPQKTTPQELTSHSRETGTAKTYDIKGASGKNNRHFFCGNCGSSLYTELEAMPGTTCIKAGGLDGGAASLGNKVAVEFYVKDRVTYLAPTAGAKQEPAFGA